MALENAYDKVNREALWQVLRMYDVGGKLLNNIKSIYVNSLACAKVNGGESECFMVDSSGVYNVDWQFNVYMDAVMKEMKMGMGRRGVTLGGRKRLEIAWPLICR